MSVVARIEQDEIERISFAKSEISPEARDAVAEVLASGWVTTGPEVGQFEREIAEFVDAPYGVAVASCTAAIELALRGLHLDPGAKVLTSTMTFCGAVNAIIHAGLEPVLVDVDPVTLMPDARTTAEAVHRAGGVDGMVVVHYGGYPAPVQQLAEAAGLPLDLVVEDAAHALGTVVGDRPVGSISAATCFSFYATKNLPIGEGGMITTADDELADFIRRTRLHGMSRDAWKRYMPGAAWRYEVNEIGLKANMTDIQAAIGRAQLQHFEGWQRRREHLVRRYDANLGGVGGIQLPAWPEEGRHAWHLYVIQIDEAFGMDRDQLLDELAERGIGCSVHFIPAHVQPFYQRFLGSDVVKQFPRADEAFTRILSLPLYPALTEEQVDRVCEEIVALRPRRMDRVGALEVSE
jgi:dTDP-4-amino-4,6-dideoxygalactose transaminase